MLQVAVALDHERIEVFAGVETGVQRLHLGGDVFDLVRRLDPFEQGAVAVCSGFLRQDDDAGSPLQSGARRDRG
jgi:hypothetical protein